MQGMPEHGHEAVMVGEVLRALNLDRAGTAGRGLVVMDCTVGRGGHLVKMAQAIAGNSGGMLIALDVDPENLKFARRRFEEASVAGGDPWKTVELRTFHANFGEAGDVLDAVGVPGVDALLVDFGVSTNQLLDAKHGLSFNADLALDMRLDPRIKKKASDLVNQLEEEELADILFQYAQERFSRRIARKIIQTRATEPILTTSQLARLVRSVVPGKFGQIDPATRTFQALRMAVNGEVESIESLLDVVPSLMNAEGRAAFLSFHSGEDRLVKQAVKSWEESGIAEALTKKPLEPGENEMHRNPRSRSAKLRATRFLKNGSVVKDDRPG